MSTYDHRGEEVFAEDVLDAEELADLYRRRGWDFAPKLRRGHDAEPPATWEPTEADQEAGREQ